MKKKITRKQLILIVIVVLLVLLFIIGLPKLRAGQIDRIVLSGYTKESIVITDKEIVGEITKQLNHSLFVPLPLLGDILIQPPGTIVAYVALWSGENEKTISLPFNRKAGVIFWAVNSPQEKIYSILEEYHLLNAAP